MTPHEGTPLWDAVDEALAALEATGALTLAGERADAIALLCERLAGTGVLKESAARRTEDARRAFADFLDETARLGVDAVDWQGRTATHYFDARVEEARRQALFVQLRLAQGSIEPAQAAVYFANLARGLREGGEGGATGP